MRNFDEFILDYFCRNNPVLPPRRNAETAEKHLAALRGCREAYSRLTEEELLDWAARVTLGGGVHHTRPTDSGGHMYYLSNRQAKELLVRHTRLRVALPAPVETPGDLVAWAKSVLPGDVSPLVTHVEETELVCAIPKKRNPQATLTDHIGGIVGPDATYPVICVAAIVVTLTPRQQRHERDKIQWASHWIDGNERIPRK